MKYLNNWKDISKVLYMRKSTDLVRATNIFLTKEK